MLIFVDQRGGGMSEQLMDPQPGCGVLITNVYLLYLPDANKQQHIRHDILYPSCAVSLNRPSPEQVKHFVGMFAST